MVFGQNSEKFDSGKNKRIPSERIYQEEQNGTNFSFTVPSSQEFMSVERMHVLQVWFGTDCVYVQ